MQGFKSARHVDGIGPQQTQRLQNFSMEASLYRVIRNDCRGFNNFSYIIHLRQEYIFFYLIEQYSNFLLHTLQVLYMCTLCDSTNINRVIEFVPNCLSHVSGDGSNGGSDSYLQFRDTCGKRRNINLILDGTSQNEITWGCVWRTRWQVVKTRQSFRITLHFSTREVMRDVTVKQ